MTPDPWLIAEHLGSLGLVILLFVIATGVGGRGLALAGIALEGALETLLVRTALGLGVIATAIFALGLVLGVHAVTLWLLLLALAALVRREFAQVPTLLRDALSLVRASSNRAARVVLLLATAALLVHALTPPLDWDALMYHLRVPQEFLDAAAIYLPPDNTHFAYVGLAHMLYLPLLAAGSDTAPALVSALCTTGLVLAAFETGRRFFDARTAGNALVAIWGCTILLLVGGTARVDTIVAFYLLLVHHLCLGARERRDRRLLFVAAVLGGFAVGVKLTAVLYLLVLAPLGFWLWSEEHARSAKTGLVIAALVLAAAAPWLLKNAVFLGDPFYPFLHGPRLDPWLASVFGDASVPRQINVSTFSAIWRTQQPFNLRDFFVAPGRISVEPEGLFYYPNVLLLALPLGLFCWRSAAVRALALPALAYAALVIALQPTTSLRYLIPALSPLILVSLYATGQTLDRFLRGRNPSVALAAFSLIAVSATASFLFQRFRDGTELRYLLAAISREQFLEHSDARYADAVAATNGRLSAGDRALMIGEGRGYYFRAAVTQDDSVMNWPLLALRNPRGDCLRSLGFTHVLLNHGTLAYYEHRGMDPTVLAVDAFRAFAADCLDAVWANSAYTLYAIRPAT